MIRGSLIFDLKDAHGLPIDFALDRVMEAGEFVEWPSFIERARECGWPDFRTFETLCHALEDSSVGFGARKDIVSAFKRYVLAFPQ